MPIKAENKTRYPANWREIREKILERAGRCCERCGVPNGAYRTRRGKEWSRCPEQAEAWAMDGERVTRIVITIAHLDHEPEHNDPANLAALCQRCHLRHDIGHHQRTAYRTRRAGKALGDLFDAHP